MTLPDQKYPTLKPASKNDLYGDSRADFSGVTGSVDSTADQVPLTDKFGMPKADFSGVSGSVESTADVISQRSYTVAKGDTLSHIAQQFYGTATEWSRIFQANRDQIDDPDVIHPGQVLKIPGDSTS